MHKKWETSLCAKKQRLQGPAKTALPILASRGYACGPLQLPASNHRTKSKKKFPLKYRMFSSGAKAETWHFNLW